MTSKKSIVVKSNVTVKKSSDIRVVARKAVAGMSEAELIERNSIGTYTERQDNDDDGDEEETN